MTDMKQKHPLEDKYAFLAQFKADVLAAYDSGMKPCRGEYFRERTHCCGLGAAMMTIGTNDKCLDNFYKDSPAWFFSGFFFGFDGKDKSGYLCDKDGYMDGYEFGKEMGEYVFATYGTETPQ